MNGTTNSSVTDDGDPGPLGWVVYALVLGVVWTTCVAYFWDAREQYRSASFPSVEGRMTNYFWVDTFSPCGPAAQQTGGLNVEYNYSVHGRRYFGFRKRFAYRAFSSGSPAAIALANSWGKGKVVKVFYDPDDPSNAALDNLFTKGDWKTLAVAIVFCLVTTMIGVTAIAQTWIKYRKAMDKQSRLLAPAGP